VLNNLTAHSTAVQLFTCHTAATAKEWRYLSGSSALGGLRAARPVGFFAGVRD
jgi:hypothetical protein